jgi:hypothetical protein
MTLWQFQGRENSNVSKYKKRGGFAATPFMFIFPCGLSKAWNLFHSKDYKT